MRNGKTLLRWIGRVVVLTMVVTGASFTADYTSVTAKAAPALEPTDSGAPSAIVMFPVTEKPNPTGAGMRPVVFNHFVHESAVENCEACHHTGDQVPCASCHTVEGKEDGNFITLDRAMHAVDIAKRPEGENTPSSCVSCHVENLKRRECAGCHSIMPNPPRKANYCATCHSVTAEMTKAQLIAGVKGELSAEDNEALAAQSIAERKTAVPYPGVKIPSDVLIDGIADKYEGNLFVHDRHYTSLIKRIGDDKLAAAFHNDPLTLCAACHHNSPLSANPPKCINCHTPTVDPAAPGRPALKAAYHLQCMGCHTAMNVARPQNTSCTTCHKERVK